MELEPSAKPTTLSPHNLTSYAHDYHQTGHLTDHHHTDHLIAEYTTETAVATPQCRVDAIQTTTSSDTSPYTSPYTSLESSSEIAAAERPLQPGGAAEDLTDVPQPYSERTFLCRRPDNASNYICACLCIFVFLSACLLLEV